MNPPRNLHAVYIVVAAGMWISIFTATAIVLKGTPYLLQVLLIQLGGAIVFVILMPAVFLRPPVPPRSS